MEDIEVKRDIRFDLPIAGTAPADEAIFIEHHHPKCDERFFHFHTSIEINYLDGCDMTYSFSGDEVLVKERRFAIFWAAYPHLVQHVTTEEGTITNAYVSLSEFLSWPLPAKFVNAILRGAVLCSKEQHGVDGPLTQSWAEEKKNNGTEWQQLHSIEIQAKLHRIAVQGWDVAFQPKSQPKARSLTGNAIINFQTMLNFIAENFTEKIAISHVAESAGVSRNYAISLFKKMLGRTIKEYITDMRIVHAKMLLVATDKKILTVALDSGFGSLSPFYEVFGRYTGVSPLAFRNGERHAGH